MNYPKNSGLTGTPIHSRRLDTIPLATEPYEYLTALARLNDHAVQELGAGLLAQDKDLVMAAARRLRSIGTLAEIAAESL